MSAGAGRHHWGELFDYYIELRRLHRAQMIMFKKFVLAL